MIYGYARCSTNEREQDINRQVRELKQQGATDKTIYLEYESGMKTNRAELAKLLDIVKAGALPVPQQSENTSAGMVYRFLPIIATIPIKWFITRYLMRLRRRAR